MVETAEKVLQIRFVHVAHGFPRDDFRQRSQCMMSTDSWPATKRTGQKVLFVDRCQDTGHAAL
jgi:hypoxanthine phosphoribosyltransferase